MSNDENLLKTAKTQDDSRRKQSKKCKTNKFDGSVKVNHPNHNSKRFKKNTLHSHELSCTNELDNEHELNEPKDTANNKTTSLKGLNVKTYQSTNDEITTTVKTKKNKAKKSKKLKKFDSNSLNDEQEKEPRKTTLKEDLDFKENDDYKPGMITEMLQIRKFGKIILPWDPSFGLDPSYKPPPWDGEGPKPIVNCLFDLSKRTSDGTVGSTDASDRSIFVGNLNVESKVGDIKKLFRKCGKIIKVKLITSGMQKSSGDEICKQINAIIRFETAEGCAAALKLNGKLYKDHHIRVTLHQACTKADPRRSVFVGNIAFGAGDDDLWKVFENCGDIESVRVVRDKQTGKSRGFGYVNFKSSDSVDKAVALDKASLMSHELRVTRNEDNTRSLSNTIKVKRKNKKKRKKLITNSKQETAVQGEEKE